MEPPSIIIHSGKFKNFSVQEPILKALSQKILSLLHLDEFELSLELVSERTIKSLNESYRGLDKVTDVLSFPQLEFLSPLLVGEKPVYDGLHKMLGDIAICLAKAQENAVAIGHALDREVCFLLIHGILHLCGHDHLEPEEEGIMLAQQKLILSKLSHLDWAKVAEVKI